MKRLLYRLAMDVKGWYLQAEVWRGDIKGRGEYGLETRSMNHGTALHESTEEIICIEEYTGVC